VIHRGVEKSQKILLQEDLEELESHIRDQVSDLVGGGKSENQAFAIAAAFPCTAVRS